MKKKDIRTLSLASAILYQTAYDGRLWAEDREILYEASNKIDNAISIIERLDKK